MTEPLALTDPFLLPADVLLTPVATLPARISEKFDHEAGDVAITRPRARTPSSIVDPETAALLEQFRRPSLIVEAVIRRSLETRTDPDELLENVYPVLESLILSRLLVPAGSVDADAIDQSCRPEDEVLDHVIVRPIQVLEDTELYLARSSDGSPAAIKLLRSGAHARVCRMFRREGDVLLRLDGRVNPRLLGRGTHRDQPALAMEWREGIDAAAAAAELRGEWGSLLGLCSSIVRAYAHLHAQGVVHADIHPRNMLIAADGAVSVIDYGLSRFSNDSDDTDLGAYRAGVGFFFEPEYAQVRLAGEPPPVATFLGEQYSVAALLYSLFTGVHYVDFSLERDALLRQIAENSPVAFADRGLPAWTDVENALGRALQKRPRDRFAGMDEFALALEHAKLPARSARRPGRVAAARTVTDAFVARVGLGGTLIEHGVPSAPSASVNYGAAGIAVALYRLACIRRDASLLAAADVWAQRAAAEADRHDAFHNDQLEITPEVIGRISPYHTVSGVHVIRASIAQALGDPVTNHEAVTAFRAASLAPCDGLDLVLGRSGTLLACALLLKSNDAGELVRELGDSTLQSIWDEVDQMPPVSQGVDIPHLGMAHGWAGVLYATLRWCHTSRTALPQGVSARLTELAALAEPSGRGSRWPVLSPAASASGRDEFMSGWCNGSAGYVHLWALASEVLDDDAFLTLASRAGWHAWEETRSVGQLCCGLGGQAYALRALYRHTGDGAWAPRAHRLAERASTAAGSDEFPDSLFKGKAGIAVLIADLDEPDDARMPFFEEV
jgi:eukaryotic-like serine/threonine-protein kinase